MDTPTGKNVNPVEGTKPATPKPPKKTKDIDGDGANKDGGAQ